MWYQFLTTWATSCVAWLTSPSLSVWPIQINPWPWQLRNIKVLLITQLVLYFHIYIWSQRWCRQNGKKWHPPPLLISHKKNSWNIIKLSENVTFIYFIISFFIYLFDVILLLSMKPRNYSFISYYLTFLRIKVFIIF